MNFHGFAVHRPHAALEPYEFAPAKLGPHDIEVEISHCGICHSDVHIIDDDWGSSSYPAVPGHEIVGHVTARGSEVTAFSSGDRVGIGWQASSCGQCEWCIGGDENLCRENAATCMGRPGGFADRIRIDSRFAFAIPDALSSEHAAPLLCGGITVYTPFRTNNVKPEHRVGIIGVGGLGHFALQFARAMGCEVTAFTTSPDKADEARSFGAHHVVSSVDSDAHRTLRSSLDFILSTVYVSLDWKSYLGMLRPKGTLCFLSGLSGKLDLPSGMLMSGHRRITGSTIGNRTHIREMLDFAARHNIVAKTERYTPDRINEAMDRVRSGKARYRVVLDMTT
jgi:uncharacterized zinc-type alcohol dehydrogenase-like protein